MAVKKNKQASRMPLNDEEASEIIRNNPIYGDYAKTRSLTQADRKKIEKDKNRSRYTYDLPTTTVNYIKQISTKESVNCSQLVNCFLVYAINEYLAGKVNIEKESLKKSLQYDFKVIAPRIKNS